MAAPNPAVTRAPLMRKASPDAAIPERQPIARMYPAHLTLGAALGPEAAAQERAAQAEYGEQRRCLGRRHHDPSEQTVLPHGLVQRWGVLGEAGFTKGSSSCTRRVSPRSFLSTRSWGGKLSDCVAKALARRRFGIAQRRHVDAESTSPVLDPLEEAHHVPVGEVGIRLDEVDELDDLEGKLIEPGVIGEPSRARVTERPDTEPRRTS